MIANQFIIPIKFYGSPVIHINQSGVERRCSQCWPFYSLTRTFIWRNHLRWAALLSSRLSAICCNALSVCLICRGQLSGWSNFVRRAERCLYPGHSNVTKLHHGQRSYFNQRLRQRQQPDVFKWDVADAWIGDFMVRFVVEWMPWCKQRIIGTIGKLLGMCQQSSTIMLFTHA